MIKVTIDELFDSREALQSLVRKNLPISVGFKVARAVREIQRELNTFEEQRVALVTELGTDDKGMLLDAKVPEFQQKMAELGKVEVELNCEAIEMDKLGDMLIEPRHLINLGYLLKALEE